MKRILLVTLLALPIAGCGPSGCAALNAVTGNEAVAGKTVLDEKALYGAEAALFGANIAAESAVDAHLLVPGSPLAIKVADGLQKAHEALDVARAAYRAGDATSFGERIAAAQALVADAWKLIPKKDA